MQLLKDSNGQMVKGIATDQNYNPYRTTSAILQRWLNGGGLPVTWPTLVKCLRDAKLNAAADDIESALSQGPSITPPEQPTSCM